MRFRERDSTAPGNEIRLLVCAFICRKWVGLLRAVSSNGDPRTPDDTVGRWRLQYGSVEFSVELSVELSFKLSVCCLSLSLLSLY